MTQQSETVWVVSFEVDEEGALLDYQIDEFYLPEYSATVVAHLRNQMGKGVFTALDEAKLWASTQLQPQGCGGCCQQKGTKGGCGCPHAKA